MSHFLTRAAALAGWLAHAMGRLFGSIVWFAPRSVPWALLVAALLALGAWQSVEAANAIVARQPRPQPAGLADVVDNRVTGWVGISSIVRGPYLDSASYGAPVQRWYYLLFDPRDASVAMVARSPERLEERRTRTIVARVESDPAAVAATLGELDAGPLRVDPERYLVELPDERPSALTGADVATPAGRGLDRREAVLRGTFGAARETVDGAWEYLVEDGGRAVVVRSPYPPDALPVDVWGVSATDRLRAEQAAAVRELQRELGNRRLPDRRLLAEGVTPPIPEASYLPAMLLAALAAILVIGWLVGYPVFRRRSLESPVATWAIGPGDELGIDLTGSDRRGPERIVVDGAPAQLVRLPVEELERRSWQYALRDAAGLAPATTGRPAGSSALAVLSGEGPILVRLDTDVPGMDVAVGDLVHVGSARPALRLRATGIDLIAAFSSAEELDRAVAAVAPERAGELLPGRPPPARVPHPAEVDSDRLPAPVRTAAVALAVVGLLLVVGGLIGLPEAAAEAIGLFPSLAQLSAGAGMVAVGRGVLLRRSWAQGLGFTVAWVGAAIAAFLVVAAPQCGLWLAPNLAACRAIGPLGSAAALGAAIGLGYAAFAIRRHASAFVR
ncbi:MAG TPA: hypothetical protein VF364_10410 [Candidatus Limnocylindria bacterium]